MKKMRVLFILIFLLAGGERFDLSGECVCIARTVGG